jgi:hypothetical protein
MAGNSTAIKAVAIWGRAQSFTSVSPHKATNVARFAASRPHLSAQGHERRARPRHTAPNHPVGVYRRTDRCRHDELAQLHLAERST